MASPAYQVETHVGLWSPVRPKLPMTGARFQIESLTSPEMVCTLNKEMRLKKSYVARHGVSARCYVKFLTGVRPN